MKKLPRPVKLDFVAPVHQAPLAGAALCAVGLAAAIALGLAFDRNLAERSRLDAALGARPQPRHSAPTPESLKSAAEAATVERELSIPWTRLLAELEAASHDGAATVSLLRVEPDPGKQLVRITAEVRALPERNVERHPVTLQQAAGRGDQEHMREIRYGLVAVERALRPIGNAIVEIGQNGAPAAARKTEMQKTGLADGAASHLRRLILERRELRRRAAERLRGSPGGVSGGRHRASPGT